MNKPLHADKLRSLHTKMAAYNLLLEREKQSQRGGLIEFVRYFWDTLEPETPFVEGWPMIAICYHLEAVAFGDINRLLMTVPPGFCKALDHDVPVLTTWGWKRHGDLHKDDFVFGPDGKPKRVLAVTDEAIEESFQVAFDDDASIVAGAGHLWAVERDYYDKNWRRARCPEIVTTKSLQFGGRKDRIMMAAPIEFPPRPLLIDPYLMGVWLGDGDSGSGGITVGPQDIEHFREAFPETPERQVSNIVGKPIYRITPECLQTRLRLMGLLGHKHIAIEYLESSIDQRWALLQGLMDTDGTATPDGHCSLSSKWASLRNDVKKLLDSLGVKNTIRVHRNKQVNKDYFYIYFTPPQGAKIFRMKRKQDRLDTAPKHTYRSDRTKYRYVMDVVPVGQRRVKCICVEGGLYLAGSGLVPTHNSLLTDVFFPAWLWSALDLPGQRILAFSYSASLTQRDNERFRALIMSDKFQELWGDRFKLEKIGEMKISNDKTGWKMASSVGGVATGARADLVIADDLHSIKDVESETMRTETVRWFREAMSNRLNNMETSAIVIIMQRSHDMDVAGAIIDEGLPYCVLSIEMEYDPTRETAGMANEIGWVDPREVEGELAWPARFSRAVVETLRKTLGPWSFTAQYQQNPVPRGGGILQRSWWRPWDNEEAQLYGLEWQGARKEFPRFELVFASVDTAYGEREENAYSAMTVWGVFLDRARNRRLMLAYAWKKRVPLHGVLVDRMPGEAEVNWRERQKQAWGLVEWVADTCRRYKVQRLLIEDKTKGHDLAAEIVRLYTRENWGVELLGVSGDKVSRAHSVVPIFADGAVYSPDTKWSEMVMMDCQRFPKGADKDLVDTVTQAVNWARTRGLIERADETSAALEEEAVYHHPQQTVAEQYGV